MWESKRKSIGIEADVTKQMLKDKYHWSERGPEIHIIIINFSFKHACILFAFHAGPW